MAVNWWEVGQRWRDRREGVVHGTVMQDVAEFAGSENLNLKYNTIRGYKAAVDFIERMRAQGLLSNAQVSQMISLPLKAVAVLERVERYGVAVLRPVLQSALEPVPADRKIGRSEWIFAHLRRLENEIRMRPHPALGGDKQINAHGFRLLSASFRDAAMSAWRGECIAAGQRTTILKTSGRLPPFLIDGLTSWTDGYCGVRVVTEVAATTIRPRLAEMVAPALAAARVFETLTLIARSQVDAEDLGHRIGNAGKCGVGVTWWDPRGLLVPLHKAERQFPPDLTSHFAAKLAGLLPKPLAGIKSAEVSHKAGRSKVVQ